MIDDTAGFIHINKIHPGSTQQKLNIHFLHLVVASCSYLNHTKHVQDTH